MGCNCKTGEKPNVTLNSKSNTNTYNENDVKNSKLSIVLTYTAKMIGFLVGVLLLPLINIAIIWFMFKTLVLNKEVDLKLLFSRMMRSKKIKDLSKDDEDFYDEDDDEDDYDDFENLTENDVIMVDVDDITPKNK